MDGIRKIDDKQVEIKRMYVRSKFRRKGLGKELIIRLIRDAKEFNYLVIRLTSGGYMKGAHKLYESIGFSYAKPFP